MTFTTDEIVDAPTDAIVDAETGCLLRLISYSGDTLVIWSELDDISTEPADPDEFRVHVPPGTRIVEETGNLITDAAAAMPGVKGTAARAAAEAVNRTVDAVSPPGASWTTCAAIARQEHAGPGLDAESGYSSSARPLDLRTRSSPIDEYRQLRQAMQEQQVNEEFDAPGLVQALDQTAGFLRDDPVGVAALWDAVSLMSRGRRSRSLTGRRICGACGPGGTASSTRSMRNGGQSRSTTLPACRSPGISSQSGGNVS